MSAVTDIDFDAIGKYQRRTFVADDANLCDVDQIKGYYTSLLDRNVLNIEELERWILDRSELEAAIDQVGSILYIKMTCQTDDSKKSDAYKSFVENVSPAIMPLEDSLNKKYLELGEKFPSKSHRYDLYKKDIKTDVDLFVEKNVELKTKVELLSQEYQTIIGAMTVEFEGQERTLPEMSKFLLEPNRDVRELAWKATAKRRLEDKEKLETIFDKMMELRNQIAQNAGCANFCDYKFRSMHRFDYTPDDCKQYHKTVEELLVPLWKEILQKRKDVMKLDQLRPWDTGVDPLGRDALKPFENVTELIAKCKTIFNKVDDELGKNFTEMDDLGVLDLASRKGKAPGGYQSTLNESRKPFIFMNAVGVDDDVRTLLHEAGHAFHALACSKDPLVDYRHGPMEFNEVASMAMELLAGEYLEEFYEDEDDLTRSKMDHLEGIIFVLIWVAIIDCFQHWIYENPGHLQEERKKEWLAIQNRFSAHIVDWSGFEDEQAYGWHRQLHIFEVPFYYIEYGIAQLGALQVWRNSKKNTGQALSDYKSGLALGGSKSLPEIYAQAGIKFDFSKNTIKPLVALVQEELEK
jgi:oligoendopeptidase F